jgi:hypothetical protein
LWELRPFRYCTARDTDRLGQSPFLIDPQARYQRAKGWGVMRP